MQKGLAREKEDRFQSAEEFINAMLDAVADLSPEQLDARPSGGAPGREAGGSGSRPSVSGARKAGSANSARPAGSKPSASAPKGSVPSNVIVAKSGGGSSPSANRPRPAGAPSQRTPAVPSQQPSARPAPASEPEGMSAGKKAALIGIPVLLLAAGAAVLVLKPGGNPTPQPQVVEVPHTETPTPAQAKTPPPEETKPPPPAAAPVILVKCTSTPTGAAVLNAEGVQIGTTPMDLKLPRDKKYKLTFRLSGYQDADRPLDFSVSDSESMQVDVTLTAVSKPTQSGNKKPPKQGSNGSDISVFE
jgi:serine/threonine-protein kinase